MHDRGDASPTTDSAFGHYRLLREIGGGGMATLHLARHVHLGVHVAVKLLRPSLLSDSVQRARFRNEASTASRVRHPNVVRLLDFGIERDQPYLVMDLLEGTTLAARLASGHGLPLRETVDMAIAVLGAVGAMHHAGVVHRDLKPQNIFLRRLSDGGEEPVVIDFGIAKCSTPDSEGAALLDLTESGTCIGTPGYMPPEQIRDARGVGPAADQFAIGVTIYQCLTGRIPFSGTTQDERLHAALSANAPAPSRLRPDLPVALDHVVMRALAARPSDRFPSVHALGDALLPFASEAAVLRWRAETRGRDSIGPFEVWGTTVSEPANSVWTLTDRAARPRAKRSKRGVAWIGAISVACVTLAFRPPFRAPEHPAFVATSPPPVTPIQAPPARPDAPAIGALSSRVEADETSTKPLPPRVVAAPPTSPVVHRGTNGVPILE
jgi:serine/threonine protein kinase